MAARTSQDEGRAAEARFAERHGMRLHSNSGATVRYKMDIGSTTLVVEHKYTTAESYRLTAAELRKMREQSRGAGARDITPAHVVEMAGFPEPVWSLCESDLLAIARGDVKLDLSRSSHSLRRSAADPSFE